ncbi:hypothetical protein ACHAWF_006600 [Thalassiosira exigua]
MVKTRLLNMKACAMALILPSLQRSGRASAFAYFRHAQALTSLKRRRGHSLPSSLPIRCTGIPAVTRFCANAANDHVATIAAISSKPHDGEAERGVHDVESDRGEGGASQTTTETWQNHRSRWAKRKHRKKMEKFQLQQQQGEHGDVDNEVEGLDWEKFEFSTSPKMDTRFDAKDDATTPSNQTGIPDHVLNTISTDSVTYRTYLQSEASLDEKTSSRSLESQSELLALSPDVVQQSIDILTPYVQPRRLERIDEVLGQRTRHTRFLFENPSNPSNVWACLRTLDSFGIQYVDVVVHSDSYQGKSAVNQKRGMRTAMGSAMWMTIRQFGSTEEAVRHLREVEGCLIYASDLNPNARDVRDLTWDVDFEMGSDADDVKKDQRPICIVMGNEDRGISQEMRELADETFYLPMSGFAESFNLSVATAITLAYMSAVSGRGAPADGDGWSGPLRPGDLDSHELQCLKLKGVLNSLAQKRVGKVLLKKAGIVLPKSLSN